MNPMSDQMSAATKAQIESQIELLNTLTARTVDSIEKIIALNVTATKSTIDDATARMNQALQSKSPQEALAGAQGQAQPAAEKVMAYSRNLAEIVSTTQTEFARTVERQIEEGRRQINSLVDELSKAAPPGSENMVAMFKTALANANAGYDQLNKMTKQATETIQANVDAATAQLTQAATDAARKTPGSGKK
jgi:phasin family protein